MASATSSVIKPDHAATRKHFIFTDEHEELRESMRAWVLKELHPAPLRVRGEPLAGLRPEAGR